LKKHLLFLYFISLKKELLFLEPSSLKTYSALGFRLEKKGITLPLAFFFKKRIILLPLE
jgi:hypothetical protein